MCAGRNQQTRTNERGFHIARTCTNVRIADTGVEPVISCLGGKRGYPFHSSAIAVCRICTHKPKLKAYYWLQSVPKSIDTQHTSRLKTTSDRSAVIPYYFQHDNLLYPGYCNHWICSYLQQISFYRFYTCRPQPAVIGRNFSHGSRTRYSMDMIHMLLSVPLDCNINYNDSISFLHKKPYALFLLPFMHSWICACLLISPHDKAHSLSVLYEFTIVPSFKHLCMMNFVFICLVPVFKSSIWQSNV